MKRPPEDTIYLAFELSDHSRDVALEVLDLCRRGGIAVYALRGGSTAGPCGAADGDAPVETGVRKLQDDDCDGKTYALPRPGTMKVGALAQALAGVCAIVRAAYPGDDFTEVRDASHPAYTKHFDSYRFPRRHHEGMSVGEGEVVDVVIDQPEDERRSDKLIIEVP